MKIGQVYCITYTQDGRKYFGFSYKSRTRGYEKRFDKHLNGEGSRHIKNLLANGARKEDFQIELVFEGDMSEALQLEESLAKTSIYPNGLNGNAGLWADTTGYKTINNGVENRHCAPEDLETYLASGWVIGRILSKEQFEKMSQGSKKNKGKRYINKDGKNTLVCESDIQGYLDDGWSIGKYVSPEYRKALAANGSKWNDNSIGKNNRAKGYIWINDGKKDMRVSKEKAAELMFSSWKKGRLWSKKLSKKSISPENILG
jgi:predicted GIY-YIG superfamily endonuclease